MGREIVGLELKRLHKTASEKALSLEDTQRLALLLRFEQEPEEKLRETSEVIDGLTSEELDFLYRRRKQKLTP